MLDELIRENARLLIRQEADRMRIAELEELLEEPPAVSGEAEEYKARLTRAVEDLHALMAGAPHCDYCGRVCKFGEDCAPQWRGLTT
jgi:hypothetical protein